MRVHKALLSCAPYDGAQEQVVGLEGMCLNSLQSHSSFPLNIFGIELRESFLVQKHGSHLLGQCSFTAGAAMTLKTHTMASDISLVPPHPRPRSGESGKLHLSPFWEVSAHSSQTGIRAFPPLQWQGRFLTCQSLSEVISHFYESTVANLHSPRSSPASVPEARLCSPPDLSEMALVFIIYYYKPNTDFTHFPIDTVPG